MAIDDLEARQWYESEAIRCAWSVRTLQRNIETQYYYRIIASQIKEPVEEEMKAKTAEFQMDRFEISSPGSWLLSSSPEEYPLVRIPSIRRNEVICGCFEGAGLMEQSATGFKKVAAIYEPYPSKAPFLENTADCFAVVLYDLLVDVAEIERGDYEAKVIEFCKGMARSREEIQIHLGIQSRSYLTLKILKPLLERGVLRRTAPVKSPNVKYIA